MASKIKVGHMARIKGTKNFFKVVKDLGGKKYKVKLFHKNMEVIATEEDVLTGNIEGAVNDRANKDHLDGKIIKKKRLKTLWKPLVRIDDFCTVICLDASTSNTGFTVIEDGEIVQTGSFPSTASKEKAYRIEQMRKGMVSLLNEYPDTKLVVIEDIYFDKNVDVTLTLAELRGVLHNTVFLNDIHFQTITTGTYRAPYGLAKTGRDYIKSEVQNVVSNKGYKFRNEDEADSVMIAIFLLEYFYKE